MADYSELFNRLKRMSDDVPIGVDVTLAFRFRPESTGYERQQPILLQHMQMEKQRTSRANSADVMSDRRSPAVVDHVTPCQTLSEVQTAVVFPMAEVINLEDVNKKKHTQQDLYEQVKLE